MSRRIRLLVIPAILFTAVSAAVYGLAETHPAKDEAASAPLVMTLAGDPITGGQLFAENCASCHGEGGTGGGVGPRLAGSGISQDDARARIQTGGGVMPADLVEGQDLEDVLAYLQTIVG
jgi:mono/diheme cytochrome c family protein